MKYLITTIAAVVLAGCGNSEAYRELFDAVSDGNIENVKKHIDAGANVMRRLKMDLLLWMLRFLLSDVKN